jgi:hypothetical protein
MPWVIRKAMASDSARPIQPVLSSHSFLRMMSDFGVPLLAVGPGTKIKHTRKTIAAGATSDTSMRRYVGMRS